MEMSLFNIKSSASNIIFSEKRFDTKLLLLFNQYEIASESIFTGIVLYNLSMANGYKIALYIKGCDHYFFASLFCNFKGEHLRNKEKCFLFHSKRSLYSW